MSFRSRVALIIAASVALVVTALTVLAYVFVRAEVNDGLDRALQASLDELVSQRVDGDDLPNGLPRLNVKTRPGDTTYFVQLVTADGRISTAPGTKGSLPVTAEVTRLAKDGGTPFAYDAEVDGAHVRILAAPYEPGTAVLIAAPSLELENTLWRLQIAAILAVAGGSLLGALVGLVATGATVRPLRRLTVTAEQVASTRDLSTRLPVHGKDEISRLTATFNDMLRALSDADAAQRRLIVDASHELRTPLASLRVNVELLAGKGGRLPDAEREAVLTDIISQAKDLGDLMSGLFELARAQEQTGGHEQFDVDEAVESALVIARRDWPNVDFRARIGPWSMVGNPARFERAVQNLLGNAAKYAGAAGPVEVALSAGVLTVSDHGPGIPEEERELVFERFHRSATTKDAGGSGLGLAIVRQSLAEMGATVSAGPSASGGAMLTVDLRSTARTDSAGSYPNPRR